MHSRSVPIALIVFLVAIPQLSETIYVPALTNLAHFFSITASEAEYTLSIYLLGFACGVFVWGSLSDKIGRKPAFILGFIIFIISCYFCYTVKQINLFYVARFFQAFGASVGSVLGQAVARDAISLENRGKLFSLISQALAFAPAIGPLIGSLTVAHSSWKTVFLILMILGFVAIIFIKFKLPETRVVSNDIYDHFLLRYKYCFFQMIRDPHILAYAYLVGSVNGLLFGYFAEAPFYFLQILQLDNITFGILSFGICIPLMLGGYLSKKYNMWKILNIKIILKGILTILIFSSALFLLTVVGILNKNQTLTIYLSTFFIWGAIIGVTMIIPNALSHALQNYGKYVGTASSLFGFLYYIIAAFMTVVMGKLHNGTMLQLPLFFMLQATSMLIVYYFVFYEKESHHGRIS